MYRAASCTCRSLFSRVPVILPKFVSPRLLVRLIVLSPVENVEAFDAELESAEPRHAKSLEHRQIDGLRPRSADRVPFLGALRAGGRFERRGVEVLAGGIRTVVRIADLIRAFSARVVNRERRAALQREDSVDAPSAGERISLREWQRVSRRDREAMARIVIRDAFIKAEIAVRRAVLTQLVSVIEPPRDGLPGRSRTLIRRLTSVYEAR